MCYSSGVWWVGRMNACKSWCWCEMWRICCCVNSVCFVFVLWVCILVFVSWTGPCLSVFFFYVGCNTWWTCVIVINWADLGLTCLSFTTLCCVGVPCSCTVLQWWGYRCVVSHVFDVWSQLLVSPHKPNWCIYLWQRQCVSKMRLFTLRYLWDFMDVSCWSVGVLFWCMRFGESEYLALIWYKSNFPWVFPVFEGYFESK